MKQKNTIVAPFGEALILLVAIVINLAGVRLAVAAGGPFVEHTIATSGDRTISIFAVDMDGDNDIDILAVTRNTGRLTWYENDGNSPPTFTRRLIANATTETNSVFAIDLDGDGDTDVLSGWGTPLSFGTVVWFENDGGSPPMFTERVIHISPWGIDSVFAIDMDGDGDMDILSATAYIDEVAWYQNDGGSPPNFTKMDILYNFVNVQSVHAADLDNDGNTDVVAAARSDTNTLAWYPSDGGLPPQFPIERRIQFDLAQVESVDSADMDNDGDTDIVYSFLSKISWFNNDGGTIPIFSENLITTGAGYRSVRAKDVDGDGDVDVLAAPTPTSGAGITWYENDGGSPPSFTQRVIANTSESAQSVFGIDLDGDGDTDVVAGRFVSGAGSLTWYENTSTCNNGSIDLGEQCEGGVGCGQCTCDSGYEPTSPISMDCQLICGNNDIEGGEECDGGFGCTLCSCDMDYEPTMPTSLSCQRICSNGNIDPGEECDDGNTISGDGCNNSCQIELGACCTDTSCRIRTDLECTDLSGVFFGINSTCDTPDTDSDGLRDECDECPEDPNKIQPGMCGCGTADTGDDDGDGVLNCEDICPGADDAVFGNCISNVPTVSTWGLLVLSLLLLVSVKIAFGHKWRPTFEDAS